MFLIAALISVFGVIYLIDLTQRAHYRSAHPGLNTTLFAGTAFVVGIIAVVIYAAEGSFRLYAATIQTFGALWGAFLVVALLLLWLVRKFWG